ncbi:phage head-tail adapter protein [Enterococcus saigonensis]|nr:phage head-tail adapter protein [Enterococcus saigonensis]
MMLAISQNYKRPKTGGAELRTPVFFYAYVPNNGPFPGESQEKILHKAMAEVYNPSMKDWELLNTKNTKRAVTINIRDPLNEYQPSNKHIVELQDFHFLDEKEKFIRWNIIDVQPNPKDSRFIKIILGVTS